MNRITNTEKKPNIARIIFYLACIGILIFFHMHFRLDFGDLAAIYGNALKEGSLYQLHKGENIFQRFIDFNTYFYFIWSSRRVIESAMAIVGLVPKMVWHILDILVSLLFVYSSDLLIRCRNAATKYSFMIVLLLTFPLATMNTAGWDATLMNYTWPMAFGAYTFLVFLRVREGECTRLSYALGLFACLYACNQEQLCAAMFLILTSLVVYDFATKKGIRKLLPFWLINVGELIFIATCPGNKSRQLQQVSTFAMEYYSDYSIFRKMKEGWCIFLDGLFGRAGGMLTLLMLLLFAYLIFFRKGKWFEKILVLGAIGYTVIRPILFKYPVFPGAGRVLYTINMYRHDNRSMWTGTIIAVIFLYFCVRFTLRMKERYFLWVAMLAGIGSKMMLGLTPSSMISGERTSTFLWAIRLLFTMWLVREYEEDLPSASGKILPVVAVVVSVIFLIMQYNTFLVGF